MGGGAPDPRRSGSASRVDRAFRHHLSLALRQLPLDRAVLAGDGYQRGTDHGEADPFQNTQRVLGKALEFGFRQLAYDFIFRPLHKQIGVAAAGLLVFVASGLIHDLVISVPARGGYGLPTGYFILQGLGVTLERSSLGEQLGLQKGAMARIFTFVVTAAPAFWLFHPPFVLRVIIPFMHAIHSL